MLKLLAVISVACIVAFAMPQEGRNILKLKNTSDNVHATLLQLGFDVIPRLNNHSYVIATDRELSFLQDKFHHVPNTVIQSTTQRFSHPEADEIGVPLVVPDGYSTLSEINTKLETYSSQYPSITRLVDIATEYGAGPTYQGRAIMGLLISDNPSTIEPEPTYIFVTNEHAREICTAEVAIDTIDRLLKAYGKDDSITTLVDSAQIWVIPILNPDGYYHVFNSNSMWRKNRRPFSSAYGVDLNRNGKMGWNAPCSGSTNPSSDAYKGPSPESEQETKALMGLAAEFGTAKYIDFHQYGAEQLYAYSCSPIQQSWKTYLTDTARELGAAASPPYRLRPPSADGELYQQFLQDHTSYSTLNELATSGFQPSFSACTTTVVGLRGLVDFFFKYPASVSGFVTSASTNAPIKANIDISTQNFQSGETRTSHARFGRYDLFLAARPHVLTFSAPGYQSQSHEVVVVPGETIELNISL